MVFPIKRERSVYIFFCSNLYLLAFHHGTKNVRSSQFKTRNSLFQLTDLEVLVQVVGLLLLGLWQGGKPQWECTVSHVMVAGTQRERQKGPAAL